MAASRSSCLVVVRFHILPVVDGVGQCHGTGCAVRIRILGDSSAAD